MQLCIIVCFFKFVSICSLLKKYERYNEVKMTLFNCTSPLSYPTPRPEFRISEQ